jgi:hypothetical protein
VYIYKTEERKLTDLRQKGKRKRGSQTRPNHAFKKTSKNKNKAQKTKGKIQEYFNTLSQAGK